MTTKRAASGNGGKLVGLHWTNNATVGTVLGGIILGVLGLGWKVSDRLSAIELDLAKIKQRIADGGTHEIVSRLQGATTPVQVKAQMTVIRSEVQLAKVDGQKPDQTRIGKLTPAIVDAAKKYPDLPESWSAISALASYRTTSVALGVQDPDSLPDCHAEKAVRQFIQPPEVGHSYDEMMAGEGYIFKNCRLYLSRLPGKSVRFNIVPGHNPDNPVLNAGGPARMGVYAYAFNVVLVWTGEVSDTDILGIELKNCQLDFEVDSVPPERGQRLLIASLEEPTPGTGVIKIN